MAALGATLCTNPWQPRPSSRQHRKTWAGLDVRCGTDFDRVRPKLARTRPKWARIQPNSAKIGPESTQSRLQIDHNWPRLDSAWSSIDRGRPEFDQIWLECVPSWPTRAKFAPNSVEVEPTPTHTSAKHGRRRPTLSRFVPNWAKFVDGPHRPEIVEFGPNLGSKSTC